MLMNTITRVKQMAHLRQKQISDSSCKTIIIDTLLEAVRPLTQAELSYEITSLFHILVSNERLTQQIQVLSQNGVVLFDEENHIFISPAKQADFIIARLQENNLREEATMLWLDNIRDHQEVTAELEKNLSQALPIFLRSLFIKHGVLSYELLTSTSDSSDFDLKEIAHNVALRFEEAYQPEIESLLPTIFRVLHYGKVVEYLKHNIEKAVGYISEVISDESFAKITDELKNLTVYLDTNIVYRLLNLQGESRYESIKETLNFFHKYGVKLKISALTQKELTSRLKYDSTVLVQFPIKTDLAQAGYRYRTSDNYVSTYWLKAKTSKISVEDFIEYYRNFDILLDAEQIEIEEVEVDEETLIERARHFFEKLSLRDPLHEKSDAVLWHDAYNFAYVQKMQKVDAKNAIDTRCLFLTTDQALTSFQREDHEVKEAAPVVIAPSQLLQMFAFSTADSDYEETFIKFFASSSLGTTFKYDNDDIQEVLSRIGHYDGVSSVIAERILSRELINSRYLAATDEEREEIIYNSVSDELLRELDLTREQVTRLESKNTKLDKDREATLELLTKNDEQFEIERLRLQAEATELERRRSIEEAARKQAEEDSKNTREYSAAQEILYVREKTDHWIKLHRILFWLGMFLTMAVVGLSLFFWIHFKDSGCLSLLGVLAITVPIISVGSKGFSSEKETRKRQTILEEYRKRLQR